jgi:Uma2 family endonuclease
MEIATLIPATRRQWSDKALMALPKNGHKYELLDGDLLMSPVGFTHSEICVRLVVMLSTFVERRKLGVVCDSSIGYRLSPKLLLSPDVSFVSNDRLARIRIAPEKFLQGAPDLAVEVLSPSDTVTIIERKLDVYFEHGTEVAWLVDPQRKAASVYALDGITRLTKLSDVLTGREVLSGFKCRLSRLFRA